MNFYVFGDYPILLIPFALYFIVAGIELHKHINILWRKDIELKRHHFKNRISKWLYLDGMLKGIFWPINFLNLFINNIILKMEKNAAKKQLKELKEMITTEPIAACLDKNMQKQWEKIIENNADLFFKK